MNRKQKKQPSKRKHTSNTPTHTTTVRRENTTERLGDLHFKHGKETVKLWGRREEMRGYCVRGEAVNNEGETVVGGEGEGEEEGKKKEVNDMKWKKGIKDNGS